MNILLTTSAAPQQTPFSTNEKRPPIGVGFLIAVLREAGHSVHFIDNYLTPSDFLETGYLQKQQIDLVGIYTNTICYRDALRMFYRLEEMRRNGVWNGIIVAGGPHASVSPETIPCFVDHIVIGEGEYAIRDIAAGAVKERIVQYPSLENLDELPMPAWDCFVGQPYDWGGNWLPEAPVFTMNTSRGCPFDCTFCSVGSIWGRRYTYFSAERIVADIEYLIETYNAKGIYFREDNFTLNKKRLYDFCRLLIDKGITIPWVCETRASSLDRETIELMARAGAKGAYIGVESGSQRLLDFMHKAIKLEDVRRAFALCREFNINTAASIIVGVPTETEHDLQMTLELLNEIKPTVTWFNIFVGIPKSQLYHYVLDNKLHEYIDDRGLVYLYGHNERVRRWYGQAWDAGLPIEIRNNTVVKPDISVVMAVYNGEEYLLDAIRSIQTQTFNNFELIIINDASDDRTAELLQTIGDPRIRVFTNERNVGLTKSLNKALRHCRGRFIARMDADDLSHPLRFEKQLAFLESHRDCALVGSSYYVINDKGITVSLVQVVTDPAQLKAGLKQQNWFGHGSVMMRQSALAQVGGYDEEFRYAQDYDLWLRLSERFEVANINEPLYFWRSTQQAISSAKAHEQQQFAELAKQKMKARAGRASSLPDRSLSQADVVVSVIVPTYNRPDMLKEAIQSILEQTFQQYEIIVVNDAGQDVAPVVAAFNSPKIRYLCHEHNKGLAATRNTGIRAARGTYLAYLDDDDRYYPDHLATLIGFLEHSTHSAAYTGAYRAMQEPSGDGFVTVAREIVMTPGFDYDEILVDNFIPVLCIVHEKACLEMCGYFDESLPRHEDWDLWIRMSRSFTFGHVDRVTCEFTYRTDGSGMTSGTLPAFLETYRRIYAKYAFVTKDRPDLRQRQKSRLFHATLRVYDFLAQRVAMQEATAAGEDWAALRKTGATQAQLQSVQLWQQALLSKGPTAIKLLEQALEMAPDNGPARIALLEAYLKHRQLTDALRQSQLLQELDPDQNDFALASAKLQEMIGGAGTKEPRLPILKVAVLSLDKPHSACGTLRLLSPLSARGYKVAWAASVSEARQCTTDFEAVRDADLIVMQRFYVRRGNETFLEQVFALGKPVIYELDDLLAEVPDDNHLKPWIGDTADILPAFLPRFSAITVSTEQLAGFCRRYNPNVHLLPNLLDEKLWHTPVKSTSESPVVIGFTGTATHHGDLLALEPVLFRLAEMYGSRVAFRFMGVYTPACAELPGFAYLPFDESYREYAAGLPLAGFDIAVVPLKDNAFNRAKSNIKWLEYSAIGVAGVYADLEPYNSCIKHGETGLLVGNDPDQWFRAISLLIEQPDYRRSMAEQARREVLAHYSLQAKSYLWGQVYTELVARHGSVDLPQGNEIEIKNAAEAVLPKVSIVIPVFNQLQFTQPCLQALFATLPPGLGCEVIVVDNASSDGTGAYLRGLGSRVRVLTNRDNLGFARACNQGARVACGNYLLFLNNDTVPQPGWLEALLEPLQAGNADICGARLLYPDGRCQHAGIAFDERGLGYHIFGGFPGNAPEVLESRRMQAVTGACLALGKALFNELGGFDEGFVNGFEDVDLCLRAGELGKVIRYVPESVVIHHAEQSAGRKDHDLPNMQRFFGRWSGRIPQDDQQLYRRFGLVCSRDQDGRFCIRRGTASAPQVSIIMPLFNQARLTQACLASLQRFTAPESYELVLVDNASSDNTAALLEQWRQSAVVLRNPENVGFAKACNQGARAAHGEYLLFLNNDTEVTDGWLEPLQAVMRQDAAVAAVGSKLLYPDNSIQHAGVLLVDDRQQGDPLVGRHLYQRMPGNHPAANVMRAMQALTAACLLVRRADFEAVGGFDEGYWNGYEDLDLCLKLAQSGKRLVYQPASVVMHHESQSGPERFRQAAANIQRLHRRWLGRVQVDAVIMADGRIEHGPGMTNGITAIYQPPAAPTVAQEPPHEAGARPGSYQLVPLVESSASTLLQRLSSSRRTREVLQRYTAAE